MEETRVDVREMNIKQTKRSFLLIKGVMPLALAIASLAILK